MFSFKLKFVSVSISVLATFAFVFLVVSATTYVDTDSIGVGSSTPGTALGIKGIGLFDGYVLADSFIATSTTDSIFGGALDVRESATSTFVGGVNVSTTGGLSSATGLTITGGDIVSSGAVKVSSSGTSTFAGGLTLDTDSLIIDSSSNRVAIGTTTFPGATAESVAPDFTVSSAGTSTVFIANEGAGGSMIILKSTNGALCVSLTVLGGATVGSAGVVTAETIACPE